MELGLRKLGVIKPKIQDTTVEDILNDLNASANFNFSLEGFKCSDLVKEDEISEEELMDLFNDTDEELNRCMQNEID